MTTETKKINTKELTRLISNEIEYNNYETEDVLKGFTDVLQEQLAQGHSVKIMGIGVFSRKDNKPKNFKLPNGDVQVSEGSYGVRFSPDVHMLRAVNTGD